MGLIHLLVAPYMVFHFGFDLPYNPMAQNQAA